MTYPMPTGAWFRKTTSSASRQVIVGLLISALLGIVAGTLQCLMHRSLHLPGHSGFLWLAFLAASPALASGRGSATVTGVTGMAVVSAWPGAVPLDMAALLIFPFSGALIDFVYDRLPSRLWNSLLVAAVGGIAFTLASLVHAMWFVSHHHPGFGLLHFMAFHLLFGVGGAAVAAIGLQVHDHLRRRKGARTVTFLALMTLVGIRRAHAAVELGKIVVTGETGVKHSSPGLTWTVSRQQIVDAGAKTLAQALSLVPGVYLRLAAQGVPRVNIWGFKTRQIKLLINGVPVNSPYDGNFDPSLIPTSDIQQIIVTTGDNSVLYGSGAMGGVINIITRGGGPSGWDGSIDAEGGSGNYRQGSATVAGSGRGWSSFFMVNHQSRDSFPMSSQWKPTPLQDAGQRQNSASQQNTVYAHSRFDVGAAGQIGLTLRRTRADYGIPPSTFDQTDPFASKPNYDRIHDLVDSLYQLSGLYAPASAFQFRGWAYVTNWHEQDDRYDSATYSSISDPTVKGTYLLYLAARTRGVHLQPALRLTPSQSLIFGFDSNAATWTEQGVIRDVSSSGGGGGGGSGGGGGGGGGGGQSTFILRNIDTERNIRTSNLMAEYAINPSRRVSLTFGASQNSQRRDFGPNQTIPGYDIALKFRWTPDTTLKASAGRKVQFPTLQELYDPSSGNPNLSAQTAHVYQVGVDNLWSPALSTGATVFLLDAHGFIQKDKSTDQYVNFNHYRMDGLQLHMRLRPGSDFRLDMSYTYLNARDMASTSGVDQLQYQPRHQFALQATYNPLSRLTLFAAGYYVTDQVYYSKHGPYQKAYLADYFVVDTRIAYSFTQRFSAYIGARNLFDQNYMQSYGFPAPGRVVYLGISTNFGL